VPEHRYAQFCPLARAAEVLAERWTLLIARELACGPQRFSDLRRRLPGVSSSVLAERLARLEERGLVARREVPPPSPATLYEFTDRGRRMQPVLRELMRFGLLFLEPMQPGDHLEPEWVPVALGAFLREGPVPARSIGIRIPNGSEEVSLLLRGDAAGARIEPIDAASPDVTLRTEPFLVLALTTGQLDPVAAHAAGQIDVEGDPALLRDLTELLDVSDLMTA
jgi:DNA-binding HxlR family transcriptional regulator